MVSVSELLAEAGLSIFPKRDKKILKIQAILSDFDCADELKPEVIGIFTKAVKLVEVKVAVRTRTREEKASSGLLFRGISVILIDFSAEIGAILRVETIFATGVIKHSVLSPIPNNPVLDPPIRKEVCAVPKIGISKDYLTRVLTLTPNL